MGTILQFGIANGNGKEFEVGTNVYGNWNDTYSHGENSI